MPNKKKIELFCLQVLLPSICSCFFFFIRSFLIIFLIKMDAKISLKMAKEKKNDYWKIVKKNHADDTTQRKIMASHVYKSFVFSPHAFMLFFTIFIISFHFIKRKEKKTKIIRKKMFFFSFSYN